MAGWQRAGDTPGLMFGPSQPPAMPSPGSPTAGSTGGYPSGSLEQGSAGGGPITADLGVWEMFWRSLVLGFGTAIVIPIPWVMTMYCRWFVSRVHVPQRSPLSFTGRPMELWWYWAIIAGSVALSFTDLPYVGLITLPFELLLHWCLLKWFMPRISSEGRPLSLTFEGSPWGWIGWQLLLGLSVITIIGWAWVAAAWMRWTAQHIAGTRRAVVFTGTGLEILWRTLVFMIAAGFIIPIPWVLAWYYRWYVSQFSLVARTA